MSDIKVDIERILDTLLFSPSDEGNVGGVYKEGECIDNLLKYFIGWVEGIDKQVAQVMQNDSK